MVILHIVFECIVIYCHIAICGWILVKDISYGNMGLVVKKRTYALYNHINSKKLKYII